jgi:hypothetical protein
MGKITAYSILVGKPEEKRLLGRPTRRWENKCGSYGIDWECVDWIHLDQDRNEWRFLVNTVMNLRVP